MRIEALDVEASIAEGGDAWQSLVEYVLDGASALQAHEAEEGIWGRLRSIGLAAMKLYFATRGTGDTAAALIRDDDVVLEKDSVLRSRIYFSVFGKIDVPRTPYRTPGEPAIFPLDAEVNLPERCYSYLLQEWMEIFDAEHSFAEASNLIKRFLSHELSPTTLQNVAQDACTEYDAFYEQKSPPPTDTEGELLVVSLDGKGVPMIKKEAAKLKAKLGKGEKRQKKKEALVGVCYTVDRKERTPEELAEQLIDPEAARQRRQKDGKRDPQPKAQNVRRMASLERSKQEVVQEIKNDAEQRDPEHKRPLGVLLDGALNLWSLAIQAFRDWGNVTFMLDIIHVVGYLWVAANALYGEQSKEGKAWVQDRLVQILKGRVGYVIGGLKQTLTKRSLSKSKREAVQSAITYFENHRRWMKYDEYLALGFPVATGVVESACNSVVKRRMEGEGKRWSIDGAEAILLLRSLRKSGDLEKYSKFHARQENHRLYEDNIACLPINDTELPENVVKLAA